MSFIRDNAGIIGTAVGSVFGGPLGASIGGAIGGAIQGTGDESSGRNAARTATEAAQTQADFGQQGIDELRSAEERAQSFLQPFDALGQQGLDQAGFLTDPQEQFNFLKNNPLFQLALDNANRTTQASSASRGRLSAGDTLSQLSNNVLLSASPLIDRQRSSIQDLLGRGFNVASRQASLPQSTGINVANLLGDIGNVTAAGQVGAANARTAGSENTSELLGTVLNSGILDGLFGGGGGGGTGGNAGTAVMDTNLGSGFFGGP